MIYVNEIRVCPSSATINIGDWNHQLTANVCPSYATCPSIKWSSSDPSIVSVNVSSGYLYAKKAGKVTICAAAQDGSGVKGYCTVTAIKPITSITLSTTILSLQKGNSFKLCATVFPDDATNQTLTWSSSNARVATVSNGTVYGKAQGTAQITASATDGSGQRVSCYVTVNDIPVTSVVVCPGSMTLMEGESEYLSATVCPTNAINKNVLWTSSDTNVATVNPTSGLVMAQSSGFATIYATAQDGSGKQDSCYVRVEKKVLVSSITVCPSTLYLEAGKSYFLNEIVCPSDATNKCVIWSSSDKSIVNVNPTSGLITTHKNGIGTIYATAQDGSGVQGQCKVTVRPSTPVEGITICPETKIMNVGEKTYLNTVVSPENATNKSIRWHSSNSTVAYVDIYTGQIRANGAGNTIITATTVDGGYSASMTLTVVIDTVTIKKDGNFNKVIFNSTGRVWYCINHDMIYDEEYRSDLSLIQRCNKNHDFGTFSDEEIKLLYAIDPYGVAYYVQIHAGMYDIDKDLADTLEYKDHVFELLFKRKPQYFARTLNGEWYVTEDKSNLSQVMSESETLFGMHPIYDIVTILEICNAIIDVASLVFNTSFFLKTAVGKAIKYICETSVFVFTLGEAIVKNDIEAYVVGGVLDKVFEKMDLSWAYTWVSAYDTLESIAGSIVAEPNYFSEVVNYCTNKTDYNILIELNNGQTFRMQNIYEAMNQLLL